MVSFYSALQSALEERLGPRTVSIVDEIPLTGDRGRSLVSLRPTDVGREAVVRVAGTAYFDVMRIPIVAGRSFDRRDNASAPLRVVVSESLAERLFAFEQPIGRQIWLAATAQMAEVVGVVGDVKHRALDEAPSPTVYLSGLAVTLTLQHCRRPKCTAGRGCDCRRARRSCAARPRPAGVRRAIDAGCGRRLAGRARKASADRNVHGIRAACGRARRDWTVWCRRA